MTIYPIITALTGFQFANLLPYLLQVVPTVTGYYIQVPHCHLRPLMPNCPSSGACPGNEAWKHGISTCQAKINHHCHFKIKLTQRSSDHPANLPASYCPPGAPFGPVHFKEYLLKPKYKDYTTYNKLAQDPLARSTELTRYNQKGPWYVTELCLFRDKYNYLPAYQLDMESPVTPKPMPASAAELPLDHTNKLFGIVYITLTGVIDTIAPTAGPWSWVNKSMSYLIKLAKILWWALPIQSTTCQFPNTSKLADQGWFPENYLLLSPCLAG
ncbi:hypothetical protein DSO57_1024159 [Entomophthora muscae]|uniref:Uncharacterized protein n=1 Tax=Entomophthora muscae TaxID=34485 RepID=A0ACC2UNC6_9FUNG|nr:hypothetical protein DSO57_1024159 [Entomophthora muscae]